MTTYEWSDRLDSLELQRSFVLSIIEQARKSGNELQIEEFEAKKEEIENEIKTLLE